jgi:hypothetical protein
VCDPSVPARVQHRIVRLEARLEIVRVQHRRFRGGYASVCCARLQR